jgi:hypothetical protein
MRFLFRSGAAAVLWTIAAMAWVPGCGPSARATPTRSIDPSTLYVAQVHWSPSEITALGIVPAFPRESWVALVAANGYVRHARVGGASRHECDECIGPRMAIVLSIDEPPSRAFAIGPGTRRLPRINLLGETPYEAAGDEWVSTSTFDVDEDGNADLERVERCTASVPTGCDERACTRRCAATRTVGESTVRGELCTPLAVVPTACIPRAPVVETPPEVVDAPEVVETPEAVETPEEPAVSEPAESESARRRHWGSRRRPR